MARVETPQSARESVCPSPARESVCPSLPPEIWITIFSFSHDLSHLWHTCRHISPTLKACAERAIGAHFLGEIEIEFLLDRHNLGGKRGPHEPAISLTFERLGNGADAGIAWFSGCFRGHRGVGKTGVKSKAVIMQRWHENVRRRKPQLPNYTISIAGMVNDTHIPGLVVDENEYRISFNWKRMLALFFREQARLDHAKAEFEARHPPTPRPAPPRGSKSQKPSATPPSWRDRELDARRAIRRSRLKQHYRSSAEMSWALASLAHFEAAEARKWSSSAPLMPCLPGAGLGGRWFGSANLVQELFLDECSCLGRIESKRRSVGGEG